TPVIMTTGYSTVENAVKSLLMGAIDFIPKPFTADELSNSVIRGMNYLKLQNMVNNSDSNSDIVYVPCPAKYFRLGNISWVCEENTGSVLIGANDLFVKTINSVSGIELFNTDDEVVQGNACAFIKDKDERMHPLLSPLSGRIIEVNEAIINNKNLIEKDPYCEENTGSVLIGANDLFVKTINSVSGIELFNTDDEVVQGNACAFIKDKDERMHPLLSPLSGRIIEVNEAIINNKNLIEKDPYFE